MKRNGPPAAGLAAALTLALAIAAPAPALAHPHVFIDADARLVFGPSGQLQAVRVSWTYDEFYSLTMIEDAGLDRDADGVPEPDRLAAFAGKDVDWEAGFPGHIVLEQGSQAVALGPPQAHAARYHDGRIVTEHTRPLLRPLAATTKNPLRLKIYDPEYFVAYDTPRDPTVEGRADCTVKRRPPDTSGQAELLAALQQLDMQQDALQIMQMPDVGVTFAEGFEVACAAP